MEEVISAYGSVISNADLKKYNTYKIGGICKYLISPYSVCDLINLLKYLQKENIKYFILGNGSNVVLNDEFYDGVVIVLKSMNAYKIDVKSQSIYAEAGAMLPKIVIDAVDNSLCGLEFAAGIPGTIGGSIYGNAGAYNACILDYVKEVTVIDENFNLVTIPHEMIRYSYRNTMFKESKKYIIVSATLQLKEGDKSVSLDIIEDRQKRRIASQPLNYPSAGSVFRNPEGDYAGRLIEMCDLKKYQIGGAMVSELHANFIINYDKASSKDVYDLIKHVHDEVLNKTKVDLIIEQEFIGWK